MLASAAAYCWACKAIFVLSRLDNEAWLIFAVDNAIMLVMIAATAILSMTTSLTAQESQKLTANKHNEYGIIYALPVTHLNIEVEAVKTIKKAGPYYRYADKYLGVKNPVIKDSETWEIRDVQISPVGVPDKENEYLMKFKSGSAPFLMLDENGLPLSINIEPEEAVVKRKRNKMPDKSILDGTDYASAFTEDMIASESMMKRAETTAAKIFELRESRNDLVSGNADQMPPDGQSLELMLNELNRQEQMLTAMFTGTTQTETKVFRVDYVPTKDVDGDVVFRMSDVNGVVDKNDLSGDPVYITLKTTEKGELPVNDKGETKKIPNGAVMYTIPGKANVTLTYHGKTIATENVEVAQFGVAFGLEPKMFTDKKAPAYVIFNPESGSIKELGTLEIVEE